MCTDRFVLCTTLHGAVGTQDHGGGCNGAPGRSAASTEEHSSTPSERGTAGSARVGDWTATARPSGAAAAAAAAAAGTATAGAVPAAGPAGTGTSGGTTRGSGTTYITLASVDPGRARAGGRGRAGGGAIDRRVDTHRGWHCGGGGGRGGGVHGGGECGEHCSDGGCRGRRHHHVGDHLTRAVISDPQGAPGP